MRAIDTLLGVVNDYNKTMERVGQNYRHLAVYDRNSFVDQTEKQSKLNTIQGWTVILLSAGGLVCGFGTFGSDTIKSVGDIGSKFFIGIKDSTHPFFQSPLIKMESERQWTEKKYREEDRDVETYQQAVDKAINAAAGICQAMSKAGA